MFASAGSGGALAAPAAGGSGVAATARPELVVVPRTASLQEVVNRCHALGNAIVKATSTYAPQDGLAVANVANEIAQALRANLVVSARVGLHIAHVAGNRLGRQRADPCTCHAAISCVQVLVGRLEPIDAVIVNRWNSCMTSLAAAFARPRGPRTLHADRTTSAVTAQSSNDCLGVGLVAFAKIADAAAAAGDVPAAGVAAAIRHAFAAGTGCVVAVVDAAGTSATAEWQRAWAEMGRRLEGVQWSFAG
jgi:hypothetical protein